MFGFVANVREDSGQLKRVNEALKELKKLEVLVGIPEEKTSRQAGEKINNAELLYIHTNGSSKRRIPARPVIEPAINDDKEVIGELLKKASQRALDGDKSGMMQELEKAGMRGENVSKEWFTNPKNEWEKNSDVTKYGSKPDKNGHKFIKGKRKKATDTVFNPLIDTGALRKSITHVIREK